MSERDHKLGECEEIVEVRPGIYTPKRCDACRKEIFSLSPTDKPRGL